MSFLFRPIKVNDMVINNRIVMPPMATAKSSKSGHVTEDVILHYGEKAETGLGLIIIEHSYISKDGQASAYQMGVYDDTCIMGLSHLAEKIHKHDIKCALQINHVGSLGNPELIGQIPVGPSAVIHPLGKFSPKELTKEDIYRIISDFAQASLRAKKAGFDMVEVHAAHGYLLCQFLSPLTNKRTDEFGGTLTNRMRIHIEIVKQIKNLCGNDFTISFRLGCDDLLPGGITLEESILTAKALTEHGVSLIDVSGGLSGSGRTQFTNEGYFSHITEEIKKHINVPVILTGGIKTPQTAESLLAEGKTDLVGIGRELIANPDWVKEAQKTLKA